MACTTEMATVMETGTVRLRSALTRPARTVQSSRSEVKGHVSRLFRPSRAAFRCHSGPAISLSRSGTPGSAGVSLLRDRGESGIPLFDCPARNGQDYVALSPAGEIRSHGPHGVPVSNAVQFAGVHAVPAG